MNDIDKKIRDKGCRDYSALVLLAEFCSQMLTAHDNEFISPFPGVITQVAVTKKHLQELIVLVERGKIEARSADELD